MIFGICVHSEPIQQLEWCIKNVRRTHFDSTVFVINDGSDIDYSKLCEKYGVFYFYSQNLKGLENGAKWWYRFLFIASKYAKENDLIFKIDPDTKIHRSINGKPPFDISGTVEGEYLIQGGCQCFTLNAVNKILQSNICLDERFKNMEYWMPEESFFNRVHYRKCYLSAAYKGKISTDFVICKIASLLSLSTGSWDEIDSVSPDLPLALQRPLNLNAAVTHPHKNEWKLQTVDSVVINYKRPENVPLIIKRLKEQSHPTRVTLIDCSPNGIKNCGADRVFRYDNLGSSNRFLISPCYFDVDFVYFHDDDALPGTELIEYYLNQWKELENPGVIGQYGKNLLNRNYSFTNEVHMDNSAKQVDIVQRSYFTKPERLLFLQALWLKHFKTDFVYSQCDDMFLSSFLSINGFKNYVVKKPKKTKSLAIEQEMNKYAEGNLRREGLTKKLLAIGWKKEN